MYLFLTKIIAVQSVYFLFVYLAQRYYFKKPTFGHLVECEKMKYTVYVSLKFLLTSIVFAEKKVKSVEIVQILVKNMELHLCTLPEGETYALNGVKHNKPP